MLHPRIRLTPEDHAILVRIGVEIAASYIRSDNDDACLMIDLARARDDGRGLDARAYVSLQASNVDDERGEIMVAEAISAGGW